MNTVLMDKEPDTFIRPPLPPPGFKPLTKLLPCQSFLKYNLCENIVKYNLNYCPMAHNWEEL